MTSSTESQATTEPITGTEPATTTESTSVAADWCARSGTGRIGTVNGADIVEASGLVASRNQPGVYWTHNDGSDTRLFAVGEDGSDLGVFDVGAAGGIAARDIEDIALIDREGVSELLIADFGDNLRERESIQLIEVPEPDLSSPSEVVEAQAIDFVYPDGPHNAETLLVDADAGLFFIVTKDQDESTSAPQGLGPTLPAVIYEGPLDSAPGGEPIELVARGTIDLPALSDQATRSRAHPFALLGAAGVATGGDVAADGSLIALRTYETVWLWDRATGVSIPDALAGVPCEITAVFEQQGEAVAFAGDRLVTIGEGNNPPINVVAS